MTPEHLEVLSALFDGERVDPVLLAEALADQEAARVLSDYAELRILARADARVSKHSLPTSSRHIGPAYAR
jgi:negative regulator of sigma E activity